MLEHGGKLREAARAFNIELKEWLDLSTGINPHTYPATPIKANDWARLPEDDDGLLDAAKTCYGTQDILPIAGSQAAIQLIPRLFKKRKVGMLRPTYNEHSHAWRNAGHDVVELMPDEIESHLDELEALVVVNPNNPTGHLFHPDQLNAWHQNLLSRNGILVVDEAFIDLTPEESMIETNGRAGLIVLRSLGKFFGLAGARVGFIHAPQSALQRLQRHFGPWTIATPARLVATQALRDENWQELMRVDLFLDSARLNNLLLGKGLVPMGGCNLFQWVVHRHAMDIYRALAEKGILIRKYDNPDSLRFGLPETEADWTRLEEALTACSDIWLEPDPMFQ